MDWKLFIARRIYRSNEGGKEVSKPAVRIAMLGIAIGLAVMIVSVAVVIGFKHEVRDKVVGLGSDIVITNFDSQQSYQTVPIVANDSLLHLLKTLEGVKHVQRYSTKPGMIMTDDSFQGMVLKGVSHEYDWRFLKNHLQEGEIPVFSDTASTNKVLVSRTIADKLHLKLGDKIYTYYIEDNVRARRLTVAGIYQTNFSAYDDLFLITDLYTVNRLNGWQKGQVSGMELEVNEYSRLEPVKEEIRAGGYAGGCIRRYLLYSDGGGSQSSDICMAGFAGYECVGYLVSHDGGGRIHHDIRFADYHSGAYQYDRGAESIGS